MLLFHFENGGTRHLFINRRHLKRFSRVLLQNEHEQKTSKSLLVLVIGVIQGMVLYESIEGDQLRKLQKWCEVVDVDEF
jgi:hypothetical protein